MSLDLNNVSDMRQSSDWARYLCALGWNSHRTSGDINIEIRPSIFGGLVKIQKPKPFSKDDLDEILKVCTEHNAGFIKIEPYANQDIEILRQACFEVSHLPMTPAATYLIDLTQSVEDLWENLSHSAKYSINRAKREGVRIEIIRDPSEKHLTDFYNVLKLTGKNKKFYVPPFKLLKVQAKVFGKNGFLVFAYDKENNVCSAKWHLGNGQSVLYVSGGTTATGRHDKSGYELVWQTILHFKSLGYKVFDLEGIYDSRFPQMTARWTGFSNFKEKFGGLAVEFPYPYVKYIHPVLKFFHNTGLFNL